MLGIGATTEILQPKQGSPGGVDIQQLSWPDSYRYTHRVPSIGEAGNRITYDHCHPNATGGGIQKSRLSRGDMKDDHGHWILGAIAAPPELDIVGHGASSYGAIAQTIPSNNTRLGRLSQPKINNPTSQPCKGLRGFNNVHHETINLSIFSNFKSSIYTRAAF